MVVFTLSTSRPTFMNTLSTKQHEWKFFGGKNLVHSATTEVRTYIFGLDHSPCSRTEALSFGEECRKVQH